MRTHMKVVTGLSLVAAIRTLFISVILIGAPRVIAQYSFTPLQEPGEFGSIPMGFSQGRIFGFSYDTGAKTSGHEFTYDGVSFTQVNPPSGLPGYCSIVGMDGGVQLGQFIDDTFRTHGYIYDGSTTTILEDPKAASSFGIGTIPRAISGGTVVGYYQSGTGIDAYHGFVYKNGAFTTIDVPGEVDAMPTGLDGTAVAGDCTEWGPGATYLGFIYDGSRFQIVNEPLAESGTWITGISGGTVVGYYNVVVGYLSVASHGFVYDGKHFITVDGPTSDVLSSELTGISGDTIVGDYTDHNGAVHGFIGTPTVPEPGTVCLIVLAATSLRRRRKAV